MKLPQLDNPTPLHRAFADHRRDWRDFRYVYPVISRRSGGLSIGINLNPDNACNFDCVYCCVDRSTKAGPHRVDLLQLGEALSRMLDLVRSGELWDDERFRNVPESHRRLNDIAFSGNGEPTLAKAFLPIVREVIRIRDLKGFPDAKPVLITNATLLHRPNVAEAVGLLYRAGGEVWAKLDAGDDETYRQVNRPQDPLSRVLDNLRETGRRFPLVIQSMWLRAYDQPPTPEQVDAFAHRLRELVDDGCAIRELHLYTVARQTTEPWVSALAADELDVIRRRVEDAIPGLAIRTYD
ncbi:MAG: radical SAM protein [Planctomycetota bacterium]